MNISHYPISRPSGPRQPLWRSRRSRQASGSRLVQRGVALAGTALLLASGGVALAAPAQASGGAVLDPVMVQRACKTPGHSGTPSFAYYTSVVLRGSDQGPSTFTFDSMTVKQNPALTQITPKQVTVPAKSTTTVTLQVTGSTNSANGPGVLNASVAQGGKTSTHSSTISGFAPMQSSSCGVTYPSSSTTPWPKFTKVVSVDGNGNAMYAPTTAQTDVTSVFAGDLGQYALKSDGSVVAWNPGGGDITLPADVNHITSIDSASYNDRYFLAVTADGRMVGQSTEGNWAYLDMIGRTGMKSISTGREWSVGLTNQGAVVAAGAPDADGPFPNGWVPAGLDHGVTQALAGQTSGLALKDDGTVVSWNNYGVQPVPAEVHDVTKIGTSQGSGHVALRTDGTVVYWEDSGYTRILATHATDIAMGDAVYVKGQDGTVTIDGDSSRPVPALKGATSLTAKGGYAVAIVPSA